MRSSPRGACSTIMQACSRCSSRCARRATTLSSCSRAPTRSRTSPRLATCSSVAGRYALTSSAPSGHALAGRNASPRSATLLRRRSRVPSIEKNADASCLCPKPHSSSHPRRLAQARSSEKAADAAETHTDGDSSGAHSSGASSLPGWGGASAGTADAPPNFLRNAIEELKRHRGSDASAGRGAGETGGADDDSGTCAICLEALDDPVRRRVRTSPTP